MHDDMGSRGRHCKFGARQTERHSVGLVLKKVRKGWRKGGKEERTMNRLEGFERGTLSRDEISWRPRHQVWIDFLS